MNAARQDRVVIMARGLGGRMGSPKGMLRLFPAGPVFVRMIADLYLEAGFGVDVVTREVESKVHRDALPDVDDLQILPAEDGRDTAWTLLTAWRTWQAEAKDCTHVWAHPVDLPLVKHETIGMLREISKMDPQGIFRPVWQGTPGHPVVLPVKVLEILDQKSSWQEGPLRDYLSKAAAEGWLSAPVMVEVSDPGTVRDFDRPGDLDPNRPAEN